jgi:hypothetical protein
LIKGIPPVIYLTMNKSIRADCKAMFCRVFGIRVSASSSSVVPTSNSYINAAGLKQQQQNTSGQQNANNVVNSRGEF